MRIQNNNQFNRNVSEVESRSENRLQDRLDPLERNSVSQQRDSSQRKIQHASPNTHDNNLLNRYNYANYPLVPKNVYTPHSLHPLPVILLGTAQTQDAEQGLLLDGLLRSRYVKVIQTEQDWTTLKQRNPYQMMVHMVDWAALEHDCHYLQKMYQNMEQPSSHLLVYFDMSNSPRIVTCPQVNALFQERYRVVKQSIVQGRHWNFNRQWVSLGQVIENEPRGAGPVLHAPCFLRESFVDKLWGVVNATGESLVHLIQRPRKLDVMHVWRKGDASHYGRLRRQVSQVIQDLNGTQIDGHSLKWLVRPQGDEDAIEKALIQPEYVASMLTTKIVVVAQRDEWEDHFRLMEALASGALVLTDVILATPHGLKNGTNIITYHDEDSLRRYILYYAHPDHAQERVAIATQGWQLVMGKHRSWHRMEQLLFGAAHSKVNQPTKPAPRRRL